MFFFRNNSPKLFELFVWITLKRTFPIKIVYAIIVNPSRLKNKYCFVVFARVVLLLHEYTFHRPIILYKINHTFGAKILQVPT